MDQVNDLKDLFTGICGADNILTGPETTNKYGKDHSLYPPFPFEMLLRPGSVEELSAIMKLCKEKKIPVTPRGGGTGLTGGSIPAQGGIVLSLERLNRIITIDETNGYVIAEAGVITADLCEAVEDRGLYFPVAPSSRTLSFIGGNVAQNAGSVNSCKYGCTAAYVMNLEVVLPDGEMIWTGSNVRKNVTGLNLTPLFIGSEGLLGIITKVVYRLIPLPLSDCLMLAAFEDMEDACNTVMAIRRSGIVPSSVELIGTAALHLTAAYLRTPQPLVKEGTRAHLLIGLDDISEETMQHPMQTLNELLSRQTSDEILVATTTAQKERLGRLRFSIADAMTAGGRRYRDIDICIPLSFLYAYILQIEIIAGKYDVPIIVFGHALDANLHTMILIDDKVGPDGSPQHEAAVKEIYSFALANDGVISGEHGIGLLQKEFLGWQYSKPHLAIMKRVKDLFDPMGILNPGKIF